jgi:transposase InsO family protein
VIDALRDDFGVEPVCRELGLSASGYYARRARPSSTRRQTDADMLVHIRRIHLANYGVYGARRIWHQLRREGIQVARCTVERLMRRHGICGVIRGQRRRTTIADPTVSRPADLVVRNFHTPAPNRLWVADLTYVRTFTGWVYVAFVLDAYSRMIVGWQIATHLRTDLALDALQMAIWVRKINPNQHPDQPLIHHSDRGVQYLSIRYSDRLAEVGITASVGSVADSYDNALAEALNGTFKAELIHPHGPWQDRDHVERAVLRWVGWYNNTRLHSELGYRPPTEYENLYYRAPHDAPMTA